MIKFILNRPISIYVSIITIIVLSISLFDGYSFSSLDINKKPKLDLELTLNYNNKTKAVVFDLTTIFKQLEGVKSFKGYYYGSFIKVSIDFQPNIDIDKVNRELRNEINDLYTRNINSFKEYPKIISHNGNLLPVMTFIISRNSKNINFQEFSSYYSEFIEKGIRSLEGVSNVQGLGMSNSSVILEFKENYLIQHGINRTEVLDEIRNITSQNFQYDFNDKGVNKEITINYLKNELEDLKKMKYYDDKNVGYFFNDIFYFRVINTNDNNAFYNGEKVIFSQIYMKRGYSSSLFKAEIYKFGKYFSGQNHDIKIIEYHNNDEFTQRSFTDLQLSILFGVIIATLISVLFGKSLRFTILIGVNLVISLFLTVLLFQLFNFSINILSVSALIIGVGLMIDNSIIVLESIDYEMLKNNNLINSLNDSIKQIFLPIFGSFLTNVLVFLPVFYFGGIIWVLFKSQAIILIICLISSIFVSIIFLPVIYKSLNKITSLDYRPQFNLSVILMQKYEQILLFFFNKKWFFFTCLIIFLAIGSTVFLNLEKELIPSRQGKLVWTNLEFVGNHDAVTDDIPLLSSQILVTKGRSIQIVSKKPLSYNQKKKLNNVNLLVLNHYYEDDFNEIFLLNRPKNEFRVRNIKSIENKLRIHSILDTTNNIIFNKKIIINSNNCLKYGVNEDRLFSELSALLGVETNLMSILSSGLHKIKIKNSIETLDEKYILTSSKTPILISNLIDIEIDSSNFKQYFDNYGYYEKFNLSNSNELDSLDVLYDDYGRDHFMKTEFSNVFLIVFSSIFILYLVLAFQFDSLIIPLVILLEIPLSALGGILVIAMFGYKIDLMILIGFIILMGYVINDSILKIDSILIKFRSGLSINDSIFLGGRHRFNAILMTSITTILSILPSLLFSSDGIGFQKPQYLLILGGVTLGLIMSLFFIPIMFKLLFSIDQKIKLWFA